MPQAVHTSSDALVANILSIKSSAEIADTTQRSSTVKKALFLTVVVCLLAGIVVPVSAQSGRVTLRGEVPFAFVSADRTIEAGQYFLEIGQSQVWIRNADSNSVQVVLSNPRQGTPKGEKPRLVFHKYGDTYFLHQIWTTDYKVEFRISHAEYNLKASLQTDEITVILAMR